MFPLEPWFLTFIVISISFFPINKFLTLAQSKGVFTDEHPKWNRLLQCNKASVFTVIYAPRGHLKNTGILQLQELIINILTFKWMELAT